MKILRKIIDCESSENSRENNFEEFNLIKLQVYSLKTATVL